MKTFLDRDAWYDEGIPGQRRVVQQDWTMKTTAQGSRN